MHLVVFLKSYQLREKLTEDQMECMQFLITDFASRQIEEVPFFNY